MPKWGNRKDKKEHRDFRKHLQKTIEKSIMRFKGSLGWGNALAEKRRVVMIVWEVSKTRDAWMRNGKSRERKD